MAERARKAGPSQMHARTGPAMQQANTNGRPPQGPTVAAVYWMLNRATVAGSAHAPVAARGEMTPKKIKRIQVFVRGGLAGWASEWTTSAVLCAAGGSSLSSVALNNS
jgi:hypothetical protein